MEVHLRKDDDIRSLASSPKVVYSFFWISKNHMTPPLANEILDAVARLDLISSDSALCYLSIALLHAGGTLLHYKGLYMIPPP